MTLPVSAPSPTPATVIPFAADAVTSAQIVPADDGAPVAYRLPGVAVMTGTALRLNSAKIAFGEPPPLQTLISVADQLEFLRGHFQHECGIWAKHARLFMARYIDWIDGEIAANRAELIEKLGRFGSLYTPEQWAFSALRPLARAHLAAPETPGADIPDALVRADIAFWTETGAVAIDLLGGTTRGTVDARRRARLDRAGIRVIDMPVSALTAGGAGFAACLPDDFQGFWRGESLPSGPFGNDPIGLPS